MTLSIDQRREQFIRELKEDMERGYQASVRNARELEERREAIRKEEKRKKSIWYRLFGAQQTN